MKNIDTSQFKKLILGSILIFVIYCTSGVFHQYLIVLPYTNFKTGYEEVLPDKAIIVLMPTLVTWLIGFLYNKTLVEKTKIPEKNSFICAVIIFISTITFTWATAVTSFPVVMAFKSCNIMSILLVAILCTRVRDKQLNLGYKKIIGGLIITVGVLMFTFFDPEQQSRSQESQAIGIILLFISLLADGFLPDFQAEIKSQFKPQPTQMMEHINKWVAIISLASMIASLTVVRGFEYAFYHPMFVIHLLIFSLLAAIGQIVVYTMIKLFKQHIVPFVITTRKIITIVVNILFYNHKTSVLQFFGMILVFFTVIFQFALEARSNDNPKAMQSKNDAVQLNEQQPGMQSSKVNVQSQQMIQNPSVKVQKSSSEQSGN